MNNTVPGLWYLLPFLSPPVFWQDLCPKSYVFKGHISNVLIYLCYCIYLFWSIHEPCIYSLAVSPKPSEPSSLSINPEIGLCVWQMAKAFHSTEAFQVALSWSLKYPESSRPFFRSGPRNFLLKFSLMGRNGRPHWTQISSPKPQRSY